LVAINCPWCEEDILFALIDLQDPEASFDCGECGTSVAFVDQPTTPFELAA
jgi:transcription elongation factor Elf1